ncbi:GTPase HflX [Paenibacillus chitinolyticus]|uniref:GTPase HflX n=1 Tax=Paenibacillus chitinolyticus TaxID=79263 RepID=UPI0026E4F8EE|nr:GTPase HflX [Paenibacillus chitinolyticus]GKS12282.1 GTPase HflX [Paenibacillus chitinolyticus]
MERQKQKAILIGIHPGNRADFGYFMEELANLAAAAGIEEAGMLTQKLARSNPSHYIGKGKIEELLGLIEAYGADLVICNDELTPSQLRNLEAALNRTVMDRTALILAIFAERARTREAQLQVEVARLHYMLPRLVGLRESLGRQGGGAGLKNRGAGETKLELDRRRIEERIVMLQKELEQLVSHRQTQRKKRRKTEVPVVCLVGYTNAGKSSLMNAMMEAHNPGPGKQVMAEDRLFATLETSVRSIRLQDRKSFLLTDTVGFVSQLPHHLVKAFRSTLEEVAEADLLLHVVDSSSLVYEQQMAVTEETLKELGADHIPKLIVYNKADLSSLEFPCADNGHVVISAKRRAGIPELTEQIRERIFRDEVHCELLVPYDQSHVAAYFNEFARVRSIRYEADGARLTVECPESVLERYRGSYIPISDGQAYPDN